MKEIFKTAYETPLRIITNILILIGIIMHPYTIFITPIVCFLIIVSMFIPTMSYKDCGNEWIGDIFAFGMSLIPISAVCLILLLVKYST